MENKINFLKSLKIFADLQPKELVDLARICDRYTFSAGNVIAYQHDVADQLYIVRHGQLEAFKVEKGVTVDKKVYKERSYFNDTWLFQPSVHPSTVRASEDGEVWTITEDEFLHFIEDHPNVILDLSPEAWHELDHSSATAVTKSYDRLNLTTGELVEYESKRTRLLLIVELALPIFLTIIAPILTWYAGRTFLNLPPSEFTIYIMTIVMTLPFIGFIFYRYLDWANDFLIITNKYLIHKDFDLRTFQGQITKIPLDQIQSLRTLRPNWRETLLRLGSIRVTTASLTGGIVFDKISNPNEIEQVMRAISQRKRQLNDSRTRSDARAVLEKRFSIPAQMVEIKDESPTGQANAKARKGKRIKRAGDRYVDGNNIIYGRHWVVFVSKAWWVFLLMLASILGTIFLWLTIPATQIPFTIVALLIILLLEAGGIYFYYEDWANDVFQVTSNMIVDIDRGPFGFTESRKTAQLINVQNVRTEQPNFFSVVFNYGDVIIDTAGETAEIAFEDVANPGRVQADIFERREFIFRSKSTRDAALRQQELAVVLDEYHKLQEQQLIPARTPVKEPKSK